MTHPRRTRDDARHKSVAAANPMTHPRRARDDARHERHDDLDPTPAGAPATVGGMLIRWGYASRTPGR